MTPRSCIGCKACEPGRMWLEQAPRRDPRLAGADREGKSALRRDRAQSSDLLAVCAHEGLALSKGIVERHRGLIDVDSKPGQGAKFTITLPVDAYAEVGAAPAATAGKAR